VPQIKTQLAELLLECRFHQPADRFRSQRPFSPDIEAVQAVLFSPKHSRQVKIAAYRGWLEKNQPCVFGKTAATNKSVYICLLEEQEILRMTRGDADVQDTIQDHRQVWKRLALEGRVSSFLILLTSKQLVLKEPNDALKEICRRLLELYMQIKVPDDSFQTEREYVFLRRPDNTLLKFSTLPNIFCAQGDGRWWHDHRTPGGIMITSNALGHFVYARSKKTALDETLCTSALEQAMRTIAGARKDPSDGKTRFAHCPATMLVPRSATDPTPLRPTSEFSGFSTDHYAGYFHTDHLIPSVFFQKERDPKTLKRYDDLGFRYIFDPAADPAGHAELMAGIPAKWFEAQQSMDRIPDFADPESTSMTDSRLRGRLTTWLEDRIRSRY
jgi:hypothetical protein